MDTTTTEIYTHGHTRALHNARPISQAALIETLTRERDEARTECEEQARLNGIGAEREAALITRTEAAAAALAKARKDRKSTRLNSSHYCASRMPSSA